VRKFSRSKRMRMVVYNAKPLAIRGARRRSSRQPQINTRSLRAVDVRGRGRKLSKRQWRNILWRDTIAKEKFHSVQSLQGTFVTPANQTQQNTTVAEVFDNANPFWTAAGGVQPNTPAGTAPSLNPNRVVVRGGLISITIHNPVVTVEDLKVRVQLIYPKMQTTRWNTTTRTNNPLVDWIAALPNPSTLDFTLQDWAEYADFFYPPVMDKQFILRSGDATTFKSRLRVQSIDADLFKMGGGSLFPRFIIYSSNIGSSTAITASTQITSNLSFCVVDI
jgi:hypothetical protein